VTSNLDAYYIFATRTVADSFLEKDLKKVQSALSDLVEANGKESEGTF